MPGLQTIPRIFFQEGECEIFLAALVRTWKKRLHFAPKLDSTGQKLDARPSPAPQRGQSPSAALGKGRARSDISETTWPSWPLRAGTVRAPNPASSTKHATRNTSLRHDHFGQQRQSGFQASPNPGRDIFARGVFQARNLVQVIMIETFQQRLKGLADLRVID